MKNKNGFTLVELLVVIIIILIIGLIVTPKIIKTIENNKLKIYKEQEKRLEEAGLKYIQNKYISENESEIKITKQELINSNYIEEIYDINDKTKICNAYVIINNINTIPVAKGYISCDKYETENYK